ncbi:transmembrane protein 115-like [Populus alba x Populus x berolinensis]|uniref:Transmembrane protein 115-like n=1 Tax=Populus alba x Populus x berolinensis TaxID=444605 RepID=A0AAD6L8K8_9ROSI|nr:transmembrane protein 115-like [Populus alba x Populus x berolinensis]
MSWIYLRYFHRKPETKVRGDPSDDFAFSSFFPDFLRPVIDPIASIFHRMLCGRFETSIEAHGYTLGGAPLPGSDPIEASSHRERGARALEERLAAERLATAQSAEELKKDASENELEVHLPNFLLKVGLGPGFAAPFLLHMGKKLRA